MQGVENKIKKLFVSCLDIHVWNDISNGWVGSFLAVQSYSFFSSGRASEIL